MAKLKFGSPAWRKKYLKKNPKRSIEYVVTSKPGMTPYSTVSSKAQARKDSRAAKKLGLDGRIIKYTSNTGKKPKAKYKVVAAVGNFSGDFKTVAAARRWVKNLRQTHQISSWQRPDIFKVRINPKNRKPASARRKRATTNQNSAVNLKRNPPRGWITNVKRVKIVRNRGQVKILVERARPRKRK